MKGAFPPQQTALYAKVSYCFKNRVKRKSQTIDSCFYIDIQFHLFGEINGRFVESGSFKLIVKS